MGATGEKVDIIIRRNPSKEELERLGVFNWPIWTSDVRTFPWQYFGNETCYFLEGRVKVHVDTPDGRVTYEIGAGDLVTFPDGLECVWEVIEPVKKHYNIE